MTTHELIEKFGGYAFTVSEDPEFEGFFSVYADKDGSGCEVAGKIGERCVADAIAKLLSGMTRTKSPESEQLIQDRMEKIRNRNAGQP